MNRPLRVGILSCPENPHTRKWSRALAEAGAEVFTMSLDPPAVVDAGQEHPVPHITIPRFLGRFRPQYAYLDYWYSAESLHRTARHLQLDILYALNLTPFGTWANLSGFRPFLTAAMGADVWEYVPHLDLPQERRWAMSSTRTGPGSRLKEQLTRPFYRQGVRSALRACAGVTVDCSPVGALLQSVFGVSPQHVHLIRWGMRSDAPLPIPGARETVRQLMDKPPGAALILSPRGIRPVYQADLIYQAFTQLLQRTPDPLRLVMLGAGYEPDPHLAEQALDLAQQDGRFRFIPHPLTADQMQALWDITDIFISAPVYDGFSAALNEGRYHGAIPVVNRIPANTELIQDEWNGRIVDPFTPLELTQTLQHTLMQRTELKPLFAERNRSWVMKNAQLSHSAHQFLELCRRVLHEPEG